MQKVDLKSMTFAELQQFVEDLGEKKFRTTQLYQWNASKNGQRICEYDQSVRSVSG